MSHASLLLIGPGAGPLSNQEGLRHHVPGLGGARGNLKWLRGCWRVLGWGLRRWGRRRSALAGRPRRSRSPWRKVSARRPARGAAASGRLCLPPSQGAFGPDGGGGCALPGLRGPGGLGRASHPALRVCVGSPGCVCACLRVPPPRPELPERRGQGTRPESGDSLNTAPGHASPDSSPGGCNVSSSRCRKGSSLELPLWHFPRLCVAEERRGLQAPAACVRSLLAPPPAGKAVWPPAEGWGWDDVA